jgi:predicted RNA-binding protein with PUA domain
MPLVVPNGAPTLLIRRSAYERTGLHRLALDERLGLAEDEFRVEGNLVLIGPVPGEESLADVIGELEALGLVYFDDFFELSGNWPSWLSLFCGAT